MVLNRPHAKLTFGSRSACDVFLNKVAKDRTTLWKFWQYWLKILCGGWSARQRTSSGAPFPASLNSRCCTISFLCPVREQRGNGWDFAEQEAGAKSENRAERTEERWVQSCLIAWLTLCQRRCMLIFRCGGAWSAARTPSKQKKPGGSHPLILWSLCRKMQLQHTVNTV